ncbi:MAG: hypothetical protein KF878_19735 [Planctomycetes bacterium]|nr:hypothetical protein [Planctomycetota bacterium]
MGTPGDIPRDEPPPLRVGRRPPAPGEGDQRCPFCRAALRVLGDARWVACRSCLTRHHTPCWSEGGGCAVCRDTTALAFEEPPAARSPALLVLVLLLLGGVLTVQLARAPSVARPTQSQHPQPRRPDLGAELPGWARGALASPPPESEPR